VIKEKVLMHDFDPAKMGHIIDSLKTARDATFSGLTATSTALSDSLTALNKENTSLKATISSLQAAQTDKEKIIAELKQLKELLDSKIITQEEYDIKKNKLLAKWE
jgi:3-methyladenine DNA glycosylase AlkC